MLGNEVLRGLTSPMGDVMSHEGIVLRHDKLFGPKPVKITGEFILGGMTSSNKIAVSTNSILFSWTDYGLGFSNISYKGCQLNVFKS